MLSNNASPRVITTHITPFYVILLGCLQNILAFKYISQLNETNSRHMFLSTLDFVGLFSYNGICLHLRQVLLFLSSE